MLERRPAVAKQTFCNQLLPGAEVAPRTAEFPCQVAEGSYLNKDRRFLGKSTSDRRRPGGSAIRRISLIVRNRRRDAEFPTGLSMTTWWSTRRAALAATSTRAR